MPRGTIDFVEFDPSRVDPTALGRGCAEQEGYVTHDVLSRLRLNHRTATSAAVALAATALHALILVPVLRGTGAVAAALPRFGTPHSVQALLIDDRSAASITSPALARPVLRPIHVNLPDVPSRSDVASGLAALYGRYLWQMDARIERAWLRPRSAIGAPLFRCEVEIGQRRDGTVQTVTLQRCNGTPRWQQSLVQAIDAASPLPAPPDPKLFAHRLVLHFEAMAHRIGQPTDGYERPQPADAPSDADLSKPLLQIRLLRQVGPRAPSAIELRIDGSRVEVVPRR